MSGNVFCNLMPFSQSLYHFLSPVTVYYLHANTVYQWELPGVSVGSRGVGGHEGRKEGLRVLLLLLQLWWWWWSWAEPGYRGHDNWEGLVSYSYLFSEAAFTVTPNELPRIWKLHVQYRL